MNGVMASQATPLGCALLACWVAGVWGGSQSNGRALSCRDSRDGANTRLPFWSVATNPELVGLRDTGFTLSMWLRFYFNSETQTQVPLMIHSVEDPTMIQGLFGGDQGGWIFGTSGKKIVRDVSDPWNWHHYAISHNFSNGYVQYYVDGQAHGQPLHTTYHGLPLDELNRLELCVSSALPQDASRCPWSRRS